jgi:hypothetical protein
MLIYSKKEIVAYKTISFHHKKKIKKRMIIRNLYELNLKI